MHERGVYAGLNEGAVAAAVRREGFEPLRVSDPPGRVYSRHTHPETKLLAFLRGSMEVQVGDEQFVCGPGDRVFIPGNTPHEAFVGPEGCRFFWSEKLLP